MATFKIQVTQEVEIPDSEMLGLWDRAYSRFGGDVPDEGLGTWDLIVQAKVDGVINEPDIYSDWAVHEQDDGYWTREEIVAEFAKRKGMATKNKAK